jgi:cardiolipin synthase
MYAIGQTVSIIMVILAFIFIFIIKKGFPSPMGFVRTIPGEDKPEKSNVIGAIEDLIRDAKKEVLITSPWIYYVDWFTSNIKQLTDRGVKVRILTWPSYERKKAGRDWVLVENKKQGFALSRFLAMFPEDTVRLNPSVHAKMIVVDRLKVMTSSSNLTQTGLWENYEAGIWMEDEEMAGKAADYFNKIWMAEDTVPLNQDMFNPHKLKKALGWDW